MAKLMEISGTNGNGLGFSIFPWAEGAVVKEIEAMGLAESVQSVRTRFFHAAPLLALSIASGIITARTIKSTKGKAIGWAATAGLAGLSAYTMFGPSASTKAAKIAGKKLPANTFIQTFKPAVDFTWRDVSLTYNSDRNRYDFTTNLTNHSNKEFSAAVVMWGGSLNPATNKLIGSAESLRAVEVSIPPGAINFKVTLKGERVRSLVALTGKYIVKLMVYPAGNIKYPLGMTNRIDIENGKAIA